MAGQLPGVASLCPSWDSEDQCHPTTCHGSTLEFVSQGSANHVSLDPPPLLWLQEEC